MTTTTTTRSRNQPPSNFEDEDDDQVQYNDAAILKTAQDALETKFATVQAGYYADPYIEAMMMMNPSSNNNSNNGSPPSSHHTDSRHGRHRPRFVNPIIKRGTFARVCCMDRAIAAFLHHAAEYYRNDNHRTDDRGDIQSSPSRNVAQIVVLGAGKDTSYFRLLFGNDNDNQNNNNNNNNNADQLHICWYEVDHGVLIRDKAKTLQQEAAFGQHNVWQTASANDDTGETTRATLLHDYDKERYWVVPKQDKPSNRHSLFLLAHDLRNGGLMEQLQNLSTCHFATTTTRDNTTTPMPPVSFQTDAPTLVLSECVQMYMPVHRARDLWQDIASVTTNACVVGYEPILGGGQQSPSSFGQVMQANLQRAGLAAATSGLVQLRSLDQHLQHLSSAGWPRSVATHLWAAYQSSSSIGTSSVLTQAQRAHANRCELLDEWEEFALIMQHYALWACGTAESKMGRALCCPTKMTGGRKNPLQFAKLEEEEYHKSIGFPAGNASVVRDPEQDQRDD